MPRVKPGEIWQVDLGLAAKVRPCVLMSRYPSDDELALIVVIPHTTVIRGNRWEFAVRLPFLEPGVFHLQQTQPVSLVRLIRKLGDLPTNVFAELRQRLRKEMELG
jgi:mRNA interferase MazF